MAFVLAFTCEIQHIRFIKKKQQRTTVNRNDLLQPFPAFHLQLDLGWTFLALLAVRLLYFLLLELQAQDSVRTLLQDEKRVNSLSFPLLQCFFAHAPWVGEWLCFPSLSVAYSFCFLGEKGREGGGLGFSASTLQALYPNH